MKILLDNAEYMGVFPTSEQICWQVGGKLGVFHNEARTAVFIEMKNGERKLQVVAPLRRAVRQNRCEIVCI